nr:hypothetical protein [Roseovarius sp.]
MRYFPRSAPLVAGMAVFLAGCDEPLDLDLRGAFGNAPSTAEAARNATQARPVPDSRGIISYPGYQVAVAQRVAGLDTVEAGKFLRIGADPRGQRGHRIT